MTFPFFWTEEDEMMAADITNCPIMAGNSINTSLIFLLHGGGEEVMGENTSTLYVL